MADEPARTYLPTIHDGTLDAVYRSWAACYGAKLLDDVRGPWELGDAGEFPPVDVVRRYAHRLPLPQMFQAVDITRSRFPRPTPAAWRYFLGVCRRMLERRQDEEDEARMRTVWAEGFAAGMRAQAAKTGGPIDSEEEVQARAAQAV